MTLFVLLALVITAASLALLIRPLLRQQESDALQREAQNIHYARERLQELEEQLQAASISASDYEALKLEIESTLASDINLAANLNVDPAGELPEDSSATTSTNNAVLITLICTLVPISALLVYQLTGTPAAIDTTQKTASMPDHQEVEDMLARIEQRLQEQPDDAEGWRILGRTYLSMGRYQQSIDANLSLLRVTGEDANIYAQLADAAALQANGNLAGQASEYIQRALALDPNQPQALWLAGLAEAQSGNTEQARKHWNKLLPLLAEVPQQQQELRNMIQQTLTLEEAEVQPAADMNQSTAGEQVAGVAGIRLRIELADNMRDMADAEETVFVFARAKNGPPAPLAVKPLRVSDLPTEITLSDADAMMPQMRLSLFKQIVVSARIAKSGNPIAQPGDIQSELVEASNDQSSTVLLRIDRLVP